MKCWTLNLAALPDTVSFRGDDMTNPHPCPKCSTGTLHLEEDENGKYLSCYQCGELLDPLATTHRQDKLGRRRRQPTLPVESEEEGQIRRINERFEEGK